MAKSSAIWVEQLVNLLGLDKETVSTQILPFLDSFDDEASLRSHLEGLIGNESGPAKAFNRDFVRSRFPNSAPTPSQSAAVASSSTSLSRDVPSSSVSTASSKRKGKKTLAERAGIGQTLPPRKIDHAGMTEEEQMEHLSAAFGGIGTVYRKNQVEEDFFGGIKGKKRSIASKPGSGTQTPTEPVSSEPSLPSGTETAMTSSDHFGSNISTGVTSNAAKPEPSPPPTTEMLAIDAVLQELTSEPSTFESPTTHKKMCFCQGKKHPTAPYAPLCYSCGLILCSAIHPSPLSPSSSCPSCHTTPLLSSAARADLVSKLSAQREVLFEQQLIQIQLQREAKKLNKLNTRNEREQQEGLFPKLGEQRPSVGGLATNGGTTSAAATPARTVVMGKHGALQKAKAIAGDAERTAKVLSLNMKTHKVTQARSKPKVTPKGQDPIEKVHKEPENADETGDDPFIGLDGTPLVRNEQDDGLNDRRGKSIPGKAKETTIGNAARPQMMHARKWALNGEELLVSVP